MNSSLKISKSWQIRLAKLAMVFVKLGEIINKIVAIFMIVVGIILLFVNMQVPAGLLNALQEEQLLSGLFAFINIETNTTAFKILIFVILLLASISAWLVAKIFKALYVILEKLKIRQLPDFNQQTSPFRSDVIEIIREIGKYLLILSALQLASWIIAELSTALLHTSIGIGTDFLSCFFGGLGVYYLASIFQYGKKLQSQNDASVSNE